MENIDSSTDKKDYFIDNLFFKKYRCIEKLGKGSFGFIYKAEYNNNYYALKFEDIKNEKNLLQNEASLMIYLKGPNIPYIKTFGTSGDFNILVMQLLGKDLQELLIERGSFSIKTVCILASQMITTLEYIHNKNVLHRDIKPENFLMGLEEKSKYVYLIDFGLSKTFNMNSIKNSTPNKENKRFIGTPRYASINALRGVEQCQKDDLESLGYVLIYLLKGFLPWQGIKAKSKVEKVKNILVNKIETCSNDLCYNLPKEFEEYIDYCKYLEIGDEPDYQMLKNLFLKVLQEERMQFDYIYDWSNSEGVVKKKSYINQSINKYDNHNENNNFNSKNKINNLITENKSIVIKEKSSFKKEKYIKKKKENEDENENKNENKNKNKNENKNENKIKNEKNEENMVNGQEVSCCLIY